MPIGKLVRFLLKTKKESKTTNMSKHKNKFAKMQQEQEKEEKDILNENEPQTEVAPETAENENTSDTDNKTKLEDLEKLEQQVAELKDQCLRQMAEFDNFRKRTIKEKAELILHGGEKVLTSLLPVLDDLERAQKNLAEATDVEALREGLELVFSKLLAALESNGLKKIETEGQDFNTDFHEAIAMVPAPDDEAKGKVIDCVQTGYMLNEKVIRHAKVAIGQ